MHFSRSTFIRFGLLALISSFAAPTCGYVKAKSNAQPTTPKSSRVKTLSKGFNLGHWQLHQLTDGYYTETTLQQYKKLGLTYTRLPIVLPNFFDENNPSLLKPNFLAALDSIIEMHVKTGMGIILCPFNHPVELYSDPVVIDKFKVFSKAFATHLSSTDPEKVFLEVMNEPNAATPKVWNNVQVELITAIRAGAPGHTIIASSNVSVFANDWNHIGALAMLGTVPDKNVVYNFHFYAPFVFTHQGANWGWRASQFMKNVPYPATPAIVTPLLATIQDVEAKGAVENYGKENWNLAKIASSLAIAADWAKTNGVPVLCNEFGAIPWTTPRESLISYLQDVRTILESNKIGWGHWFELDVHDRELMQALGLTPLS